MSKIMVDDAIALWEGPLKCINEAGKECSVVWTDPTNRTYASHVLGDDGQLIYDITDPEAGPRTSEHVGTIRIEGRLRTVEEIRRLVVEGSGLYRSIFPKSDEQKVRDQEWFERLVKLRNEILALDPSGTVA